MEKRNQSFLNELPPECIILDKIRKFVEARQVYKYDAQEKWGTKKDWCLLLYNDYKSTFVIDFVNMLVDLSVLIENDIIIKQGKKYITYKLSKDWKERCEFKIISVHPFTIFLEDWGFKISI